MQSVPRVNRCLQTLQTSHQSGNAEKQTRIIKIFGKREQKEKHLKKRNNCNTLVHTDLDKLN